MLDVLKFGVAVCGQLFCNERGDAGLWTMSYASDKVIFYADIGIGEVRECTREVPLSFAVCNDNDGRPRFALLSDSGERQVLIQLLSIILVC